MKCCQQENHNTENKNSDCCRSRNISKWYLLCLIPVILIFVINYFYPEVSLWSYLLILVCPLVHILLVIGLFKKKK